MFNKDIIKDLKHKVRDLSFTDMSEKEIVRRLKTIYYDNVKNKDISYSTYLEVTAYLVLLKSVKTLYHIK